DCEHFTLAHGTLHSPDSFDYILTIYDAHLSFQTLQRSICFLGHSHVPITFFNDNPISYMIEPEINLDGTDKVLVNVGSVGQPRDQDKRAAWALYDVEKRRVWIRRVEYDVEAAARKILEAGLPQMNAERLSLGR
ncbi:MAG: metallophosphoesterase family protein, partial [Planctomycetes bacterium]|nr:metallophosphoesterase family protein [Planctomycetota bacterium]